MTLLILTSLIVSFIAGMAALFAPCCISVLLPSYLASIFREKYKVLLMTFIFFLGILTVFLPIGLGFAALSMFFKEYHAFIFTAGGIFLTALGISILLNKKFSLPFHPSANLEKRDAASIYVLGIFSGIATTCCAPVLAGALALSVLPGSVIWGAIYTIVYVLGMISPLFFIALFLDKTGARKLMNFRKLIEYEILGKRIMITVPDLIAGTMFLAMGLYIVYSAFTQEIAITHADTQISINIFFAKVTKAVNAALTQMFNLF